MTESPSGTVSFLFTDISGSTRLWDLYPAEMAPAQSHHDRALREAIAAHGGYVFSSAGDGLGAAFPNARDALAAAIDAQRAIDGTPVADDLLRVRMGIHTGTAEERDGDYFGSTVNRAARISAVGHGGQIVLSEATVERLGRALPENVQMVDIGEHRLRDLSEPERLYQVVARGLQESFPQPRSVDAYPNNLPIQLTSFVGRSADVRRLVDLLGEHRLITLIGVGGSGKTRLAVQAGAEVLPRFPDGVWLIDFAPLVDREQVMRAVIQPLDIDESRTGELLHTVVEHLRNRRTLLVFDNCEHVVDRVAELAVHLLQELPDLHVLATSREMLGVPGEYPFQVRSLPVPPEGAEARLSAYAATRLFLERAATALPNFEPDEGDAAAIAQICRRLDGIPLAIELAAARLRVLTPEQIAARLDDAFRLLTGGARTALPRQQTLQATMDWSYDLLGEDERVLFRRLSVFAGGFTLDAAEHVCGFDPLDPAWIIDGLGGLEGKSLLGAEAGLDEVRYRQLETLRQYGRSRLSSSGKPELVRRRHAEYYARLAARAEMEARGPEETSFIDRLDMEADNLRTALGWALDGGDVRLGAAMAGPLYRYWLASDWLEEGERWLETALETYLEPDRTRAMALLGAGTLAQRLGKLDVSMSRLDEAIDLAEECGAGEVLDAALNNRGNVGVMMGEPDKALELFLRHLARARSSGDLVGQVVSLENISAVVDDEDTIEIDGQRLGPVELAGEAVELAREMGSDSLLSEALGTLAWCRYRTGDIDGAEQLIPEIRDIDKRGGHDFGRADGIAVEVARLRGDIEGAARHLARRTRKFRSRREHEKLVPWAAGLVAEWAGLAAELGRFDAAARMLGAVEGILERNANRLPEREFDPEKLARSIREGLGAERFDEIRSRGCSLSVREALEEVSRFASTWEQT